MMVLPYEAKHLKSLQLQLGQQDIEISPEYAKALESGFSFTGMTDGGRVVIVAGITKLEDHRGMAWALVDRNAGPYFTTIHKMAKQILDLVPYRRVEADTPCNFAQGHHWLKMLGFEMEAPRMRGFRIDGGDSALYARTK